MQSPHGDRVQRPLGDLIPKSNNLDYELPVGLLCRLQAEGVPHTPVFLDAECGNPRKQAGGVSCECKKMQKSAQEYEKTGDSEYLA